MYAAGVRTGTVIAAGEIDGRSASPTLPFLRAATRGPYLSAQGSLTGRRYAPVGCFIQPLRAAYHRPYIHSSAPLNNPRVPSFIRAAASQVPAPLDNSGEEPIPGAPTRWEKMKDLLIKLKGNIGLLALLAISVWLGFLAVKEEPTAATIVDVCDKAHKIYNIASKGFLIVAEILKGDNK